MMRGRELAGCTALLALGLRLLLAVGQDLASLTSTTTISNDTSVEVHTATGSMSFTVSDDRALEDQEIVVRAALKQGIAFLTGINITDMSIVEANVDVIQATLTYSVHAETFAEAREMAETMGDPPVSTLTSFRNIVNQQLALNAAGFQITAFQDMEVGAQTVIVELEDTSCPVTCCDERVRLEARLFCTEFQQWSTDDEICSVWELAAQEACINSCGNCESIGRAIFDQCLFYMSSLEGPKRMSYIEAQILCRGAGPSFEDERCNSLCNATFDNCNTNASMDCSIMCGNYQACDVFMMRDSAGMPDVIRGETVLIGPVEGRIGLQHSCDLIPEDCKNHRPSTCGRYKHCPVDLCAVYDVTCPPLDACRREGECSPSDGQCYYTTLRDGVPCDDGIFYTLDTVCVSGVCLGFEDRCLRFAVTCETASPCLVDPGVCDPATGACIFNVVPEGTACQSSSSEGPVPGACGFGVRAGLCFRTQVNLCHGVECASLGQCYGQSACDEHTGLCAADLLPEGVVCNDSDTLTSNDRCLGGVCVGHSGNYDEDYEELGTGVCSVSGARMPSYFGDVIDLEECKHQCNLDPLCIAISYKFPTCSVHTLFRLRAPEDEYWNRSWTSLNWDWASMPENLGAGLNIRDHRPEELQYICYRKGGTTPEENFYETLKTIFLYVMVFLVLLAPTMGFLAFFGFLRCGRLKSCCSHMSKKCAAYVQGRMPEKPWMKGRQPEAIGPPPESKRPDSADTDGSAATSATVESTALVPIGPGKEVGQSPRGKGAVAASPDGAIADETEDESMDVLTLPPEGLAPLALASSGALDLTGEADRDPRGAVLE